jgi:hypothetical protein
MNSTERNAGTPIELIIRPVSGYHGDINVTMTLGSTVRDLKNELIKRKVFSPNNNKVKLVFGGRMLSDDDNFMQLLSTYDISTPHAVHLIGLPTNMPPSTSTSNTNQPATPLHSPSTANTPTTQQIQQLIQQQQLLQQLQAIRGITTGVNPLGSAIPLTGNTTSQINPFQQQQQQQVLQQLQILQQIQAAQLQLQQQLAQIQQQQQPAPQPENVQGPLDANQMPQRLIGEERPRNHIVINVRIGPFITALFRIAVLCIILFPRQGWVTWLKFTLLFTGIWMVFQYGGAVRDFFLGDQNQQQQPRNDNVAPGNGAQPVNNVPMDVTNVTEAIPPQPPRGPVGTLFHIIYLFIVSLSPTYQPRGYVRPPEEAHEHED